MLVVTGANGFIGSAVVWQLNSAGITDIICVDSVDLKSRPQLLANKKYYSFLKHDQFLQQLTTGKLPQNISWIIHMGACSSTTEMNVEFLRQNNTEYTKKIFEWCRDQNVPYIYASSGAVYGGGEKGFSDTTPPTEYKPLNPYGRSKSEFDVWAVQQKNTPPHWYGLRFFNVYGPNEYFKGPMSSVVFKAFHEIKKSKKLKLFKSHRSDYQDGKQKRDFIYIKDITRWIMELMEKKVPSGIYNMGFGTARTWLDLADGVFKNIGEEMKIDWTDMPPEIRNQYQYFTEAEMKKMWNTGISKPKWPLEDGIKDYITKYLLKNEAIL